MEIPCFYYNWLVNQYSYCVVQKRMLKNSYSNTELSFWSPHMRISVIDRMVSTNRLRLWSVTVVFLVRTWYIYLKHGEKKSVKILLRLKVWTHTWNECSRDLSWLRSLLLSVLMQLRLNIYKDSLPHWPQVVYRCPSCQTSLWQTREQHKRTLLSLICWSFWKCRSLCCFWNFPFKVEFSILVQLLIHI